MEFVRFEVVAGIFVLSSVLVAVSVLLLEGESGVGFGDIGGAGGAFKKLSSFDLVLVTNGLAASVITLSYLTGGKAPQFAQAKSPWKTCPQEQAP